MKITVTKCDIPGCGETIDDTRSWKEAGWLKTLHDGKPIDVCPTCVKAAVHEYAATRLGAPPPEDVLEHTLDGVPVVYKAPRAPAQEVPGGASTTNAETTAYKAAAPGDPYTKYGYYPRKTGESDEGYVLRAAEAAKSERTCVVSVARNIYVTSKGKVRYRRTSPPRFVRDFATLGEAIGARDAWDVAHPPNPGGRTPKAKEKAKAADPEARRVVEPLDIDAKTACDAAQCAFAVTKLKGMRVEYECNRPDIVICPKKKEVKDA